MFDTNKFFYVSWTVDEDVSVSTVFFLRDGDVLVADTVVVVPNQWLKLPDQV